MKTRYFLISVLVGLAAFVYAQDPAPQKVTAQTTELVCTGGTISYEQDATDITQFTLTAIADEANGYAFQQWADGNTDNPRTVNALEGPFQAVFVYEPALNFTDGRVEVSVTNTTTPLTYQLTAVACDDKSAYTFSKWSNNSIDNPLTYHEADDNITPIYRSILHEESGDVTMGHITCTSLPSCGYTLTAVPEDGCRFVKWEDNSTDVSRDVKYKNGAYSATFEENVYSLTWDFAGGTPTSDSYTQAGLLHPNTSITDPVVEKTGYIFAGWTPDFTSTMPEKNVTYTATWDLASLDLYDAVPAGKTVAEAQAAMTQILQDWKKVSEPITVTIHRTIWRDGYYNTLCLPFDVETLEGTPLEGGTLMAYTGADVYANTVDVHIEPATQIEAGQPYLIMFEEGDNNIVDPVFTNVQIKATALNAQQNAQGMNFVAVLAPYQLPSQEDYLFIGANNVLYWPATDSDPIKGFRAYFVVNNEDQAGSAPIRRNMPAHLVVGRRSTPTDVQSINDQVSVSKWLKNGQLIIMRNGVHYDAIGRKIVK